MPQTLTLIPDGKQFDVTEGRRLNFFGRREQIPLVSQGIWQIERGLVQLSTLCPAGEEILLGWAGAGAFFGLSFTSLQVYQATALSDVYLKWFSMVEIESSLRLSQIIVPQLIKRMQQTEMLLTIAGYRRVEERLQRLLLLLKQEIGQKTEDGSRLSVRITHQDIASAIGTTRVTITRLLNKLQQDGYISWDSKRHIILKDDSFANLADW